MSPTTRLLVLMTYASCLSGCQWKRPASELKRANVAASESASALPLRSVFNSNTGAFAPQARPCVTGDAEFLPNRSLNLSSESDYSIEEMIHELGVEGFLRYDILPILQVEGRLANRTRLTSNSSRFVVFHDITYNAGTLVLKRPRIDQDYVKTLASDQLLENCGHGAVTRVQLGAKATIGIEFLLSGDTLSNYVRAVVAGRLKLGPFKSPAVSFTLADGYLAQIENVNVAARIFVDQYGGNERQFRSAISQQVGSCNISIRAENAKDFHKNPSFQACLDRFDHVVGLFRSCFQNNINIDKSGPNAQSCHDFLKKPEDGTPPESAPKGTPIAGNEYLTGQDSDRSNLAPLAYTVSQYDEMGLFPLAQRIDPSPEDLRMREWKGQLTTIYLDLESLQGMLKQILSMPDSHEFLLAQNEFKNLNDVQKFLERVVELQTRIFHRNAQNISSMRICSESGPSECELEVKSVTSAVQKLANLYSFARNNLTVD